MSKVGETMGKVAGSAVKASGVVTEKSGQALGSIARTMGVSEDKCNKMENKVQSVGKELYYENGTIKRKVESFTDDVVQGTKNTYESIKDKIKE